MQTRPEADYRSGCHTPSQGGGAAAERRKPRAGRPPQIRGHRPVAPEEGGGVTVALIPGSFDPPTNGHLDVIRRCLAVFGGVVIAVVANPSKTPLFDATERVAMLQRLYESEHVEVESFEGLLVDFARSRDVHVIVKGLRAVSDFEYELQMAQMNESLSGISTLFLPTAPVYG
ncbi:MAG TPA: pantetheine-phosphate adenylyltransferase, partial [Actinobacteria bacterium]|nr:pantetheine-phosphate adenylyltransferase [Actinomycetota bacterium]